MENKNTLIRDLVYVGIFGAIYTIIVFMIACLGYIPVVMPTLPFLMGIATGIPMFLFFSKVGRPLLVVSMYSSCITHSGRITEDGTMPEIV